MRDSGSRDSSSNLLRATAFSEIFSFPIIHKDSLPARDSSSNLPWDASFLSEERGDDTRKKNPIEGARPPDGDNGSCHIPDASQVEEIRTDEHPEGPTRVGDDGRRHGPRPGEEREGQAAEEGDEGRDEERCRDPEAGDDSRGTVGNRGHAPYADACQQGGDRGSRPDNRLHEEIEGDEDRYEGTPDIHGENGPFRGEWDPVEDLDEGEELLLVLRHWVLEGGDGDVHEGAGKGSGEDEEGRPPGETEVREGTPDNPGKDEGEDDEGEPREEEEGEEGEGVREVPSICG